MKIKTISLTDFRAFPGPAPTEFQLDGKNLLVYGENGSGKSSLFHALLHFFSLNSQSPLKNHCNVFSAIPDSERKIEITFLGQENNPAKWTSERHPCQQDFDASVNDWHQYFFRGADSRVLSAARRMACIDYKSLLDTNYKHGTDELNLFDITVNRLLRDHPLTVEGGIESTLGDLWQQVCEAEKAIKIKKNDANLENINHRCIAFNTGLQTTLARLTPEVNRILTALGWQEVRLEVLETSGIHYKNAPLRRDRAIEGQRLTPKLTYRKHALDRPQLFLNEARLSGLALALYLGGRLISVPQRENDPELKLLVLDDVLIGLDHSNRLPVLEVLHQHFADWQIVLLTHDRNWFDLARHHIANTAWACYEIYEGDSEAAAPMPIVRQTANRPAKALLEKARHLLTQGYVEAAANYARQAFEMGVRGACEAKKIKLAYKQDATDHLVENLLEALKKWNGTNEVPKPQWNVALHKLKSMKDVVMNPYSHPSAPNIPKQEVAQAIQAVHDFLELVGKKNEKPNP